MFNRIMDKQNAKSIRYIQPVAEANAMGRVANVYAIIKEEIPMLWPLAAHPSPQRIAQWMRLLEA